MNQEVVVTNKGDVFLFKRVNKEVVRRRPVQASPLPNSSKQKKSSAQPSQDDIFLGSEFKTRQCHVGSGRSRPSKKHKRRAH
ncbi:MAG TPA: hypothetical protein VKO42_01250 [Patescibacteria group bacterium]|nr:hypothetical protein [Patescibacteria group bacterium]